jgi:hypothetical protein
MKAWLTANHELQQRDFMNKFRHMLDFLKEESLEFNPVHQLRSQGAA